MGNLKQYWLWIVVVFAAGAAVFILTVKNDTPSELKRLFDENIAEDSTAIFQEGDALYSYVKKFGPKATVLRLHELSAQFGSCHDAAHRAGRFSYELFGDRAFRECGAECHSGCYHGATEAYFKDHGTANLAENLKLLCSSELNPFLSHQCIHGIGHGLMAWTNYEIFDALKSCDLLDQQRDSCYTGVFMENIVGSLGAEEGHTTKYLSDDPQYPCTIVDDQYKSSCYFLQTSRMMQLFQSDFGKIAQACSAAPEIYKGSCFGSMGRDVGGAHRANPRGAIAACGNAPKGPNRTDCLMGAAQDSFWDPSGQDNAIAFCTMLTDKTEKDACYQTIIGRAPEVLMTREERENFCKKIEASYQEQCLRIVVGQ